MIALDGIPASPGVAVGSVERVVPGVYVKEFTQGSVLVARTTDPTMVRWMLRASAIATELGGPLSHTAIVALELGIPCVVAVPDLLERLSDGMTVEVDGTRGRISLLD